MAHRYNNSRIELSDLINVIQYTFRAFHYIFCHEYVSETVRIGVKILQFQIVSRAVTNIYRTKDRVFFIDRHMTVVEA